MKYLQENLGCLLFSDDPTFTKGLTTDEEKNETAWVQGHKEITAICNTYLSFAAFETKPAGVKGPGERLDLYPLYFHAATNWGYHAFESGPHCPPISFLRSQAHIGTWLGVAGLVRSRSYLSILLNNRIRLRHRIGDPEATGLHWAALYGLATEVASYLEMGIPADIVDEWDRTPLMYAAETRREAVIEQLLATNQVDPDAEDDTGLTAVIYATVHNHVTAAG
ncbi:uncharacterized protein BKA55DRAFT_542809 [Fusarium redolens]|uniref:Ankyrin repeat protein n=1 Tax=Fusarium redolens TaxID=48865 RepID=A0A9P9K0Y8_FUSRE|nr:uncharacterized protein BKA55DRAFT_542809 [Fusarium redolens]KAH7240221.1 hypothetical protein BKA55DRAFT_542809 [Fusarium redolens]